MSESVFAIVVRVYIVCRAAVRVHHAFSAYGTRKVRAGICRGALLGWLTGWLAGFLSLSLADWAACRLNYGAHTA